LFNQFRLHREVYHPFKASFNLSAQVLVRCIAKVADAYKRDKEIKRDFHKLGSIAYDSRVKEKGNALAAKIVVIIPMQTIMLQGILPHGGRL
jgi:hypothetical protein